MAKANPFVTHLDARGWKLAGDELARRALELSDRARECWRRSETLLTEAADTMRTTALAIDAATADPEWAHIEAETLSMLERERGNDA